MWNFMQPIQRNWSRKSQGNFLQIFHFNFHQSSAYLYAESLSPTVTSNYVLFYVLIIESRNEAHSNYPSIEVNHFHWPLKSWSCLVAFCHTVQLAAIHWYTVCFESNANQIHICNNQIGHNRMAEKKEKIVMRTKMAMIWLYYYYESINLLS